MKSFLAIFATALLCGCANHMFSLGPGDAIGAAWEVMTTPDPNKHTDEDKEIMRREQEEEEAREKTTLK